MSELYHFTSEWEWQIINRGLDYTVVGNSQQKRSNWTLTRSRYSNAPYESQIDTKQFSLSAYNGGETRTISGFTTDVVFGYQFETTRNWVSNSANWVDSGYNSYIRYGYANVYVQQDGTTNKPDSTKVNIMGAFKTWSDYVYDPGSGFNVLQEKYAWCVVEGEQSEIDNGSFSRDYDDYTNGIRGEEYLWIAFPQSGPAIPPTPDAEPITTAKGTFDDTGDDASTPFEGSFLSAGTFLCTADAQQYQQRGVPWYQQIQTWSFKDAWRNA